MKRTSNSPKQMKRKRDADGQEPSAQGGTQSVGSNAAAADPNYSAFDDGTFGYSDNIAAACFATNAESSRQNLLSEREKREKRLLSNRLSARRSRERHKVEVAHLEDQARKLSQLIKTLKSENATLRELKENRKQQQQRVQPVNDQRLSLVDLATLLQQPGQGAVGNSPMEILIRAQQQQRETNQLIQAMANRQQQQSNTPFHPMASSTMASSAFANNLAPQNTELSLPPNMLAGPQIPASIRHLLDPSSPWQDASTTSSASMKSGASKKFASRQSEHPLYNSSSSDYDS